MKITNVVYIQQDDEADRFKDIIESAADGSVIGMLFLGPAGTAKSTLARYLAQELGAHTYEIKGSPNADKFDFEGSKGIEVDPTTGASKSVFRPAKLTQAFMKLQDEEIDTVFIIIDEINSIPQEEQVGFNEILAEKQLTVIQEDGKIYKMPANKKLVFIGTYNPGYSGVVRIQESFDDRFSINELIDYANEATEVKIVKTICNVPDEIAKLVVKVGRELRNLCITHHKLPKPFSTRKMVNMVNLVKSADIKYLTNNVRSCMQYKIGEIQDDYDTIEMMLDKHDFINKMKNALIRHQTGKVAITVIEEVEDIEQINSEVTKQMARIFNHLIETRGIDHVIDENGYIRWTPLDNIWKDFKEAFLRYFEQSVDIYGSQYIAEYGQDPYHAGSLTRTYVIWLYRHKKAELRKFMTEIAPVIPLKYFTL